MVVDEKSAGESQPKQEKEKHEEKKCDSEQDIGSAGVEKEKSAGEKTENAPADTKQQDDQAVRLASKLTWGREASYLCLFEDPLLIGTGVNPAAS
ncbi:uncharacterized [Tachysurus ichikawai]